MVLRDVKFCQRCGQRLVEKAVENKPRPCCPSCDYVVFLDPKLAAVVLVATDGKLVLVRRATEPAVGRWSFPSGFVDRGEAVRDAAAREVEEETGLDVRVTDLVGLYSTTGDQVVLAVFCADVVGGTLKPGPEVLETALFHLDDLPPLPFPHDDQILRDWRNLRPTLGDPIVS